MGVVSIKKKKDIQDEKIIIEVTIMDDGSREVKEEKQNSDKEHNISNGASVILPVFMDEYSKELERKNIIENKVTSLIAVQIAILTIFMPIIPFDKLYDLFRNNNNGIVISTSIACLFLLISIGIMIIAFGLSMSAMRVEAYNKVNIEQLVKEENLKHFVNDVEVALCIHYEYLISNNTKLTDRKANRYKRGLPLTIVAFLCLIVGTVVLKCLCM